MPEVNYKDKIFRDDIRLYLFYGESYIYKKVCRKLIEDILPNADNSLNYEIVNSYEQIYQVVERLNTIPFLDGKKIIHIKDSKIFYTQDDAAKLLTQSIEAFSKDEAKGAKNFASLMGILNISKESFSTTKVKIFEDYEKEVNTIFNYVVDNDIKIVQKKKDIQVLQSVIEKGFSTRSILIITADYVDKRTGLFKAINNQGVVVNCSTPKESSYNDKEKIGVLKNQADEILKKNQVRISQSAFDLLYRLVGFDIEKFTGEIEKLLNYAKDSKIIERDDVKKLVSRTKDDPAYELSNAIAERDLFKALFFTNSLIEKGFFSLQILALIFNQIKKLFIMKTFLKNANINESSLSFNDFKSSLLDKMVQYDEENFNLKEQKNPSLFIAKGKNAYAVYILFQKAGNFAYDELSFFLENISNIDFLLKSSMQKHQTIIERLIIKICK